MGVGPGYLSGPWRCGETVGVKSPVSGHIDTGRLETLRDLVAPEQDSGYMGGPVRKDGVEEGRSLGVR